MLWRVWRETSARPERALLAAFNEGCSQQLPAVRPSEEETWLRARNATVLLEPETAASIAAAAELLAIYATDRGDGPLAGCIRDQHAGGGLEQAIIGEDEEQPTVPISLAVYEATRMICDLNPQGPAASDVTLPPVPDIATVARERLMIVQDFRICESGSEVAINDCVNRAYQTRSRQIFNQLLSRDN